MKPDRKDHTKAQAKAPREVHPPVRSRADDPEPSVAPGHMPMWVFVLLAIGFYWGMVYLDNHAGGFNAKVYQRFSSSNELVRLVPFDPVRDAMNRGLAVYNMTCMPCHQPSGQGAAGIAPALSGSEWVLESDPSRIIRITQNGLAGPVTVKGQPFNAAMPPIARDANLSNEQLAQVLTYVRQSWGNAAAPVKPEQVAAVRKEIASRNTQWTAEELQKVTLKQ